MSELDVNDDKIRDKLNAKSCPPAVKSCDGEYSVAISTLWSCNISKSMIVFGEQSLTCHVW